MRHEITYDIGATIVIGDGAELEAHGHLHVKVDKVCP